MNFKQTQPPFLGVQMGGLGLGAWGCISNPTPPPPLSFALYFSSKPNPPSAPPDCISSRWGVWFGCISSKPNPSFWGPDGGGVWGYGAVFQANPTPPSFFFGLYFKQTQAPICAPRRYFKKPNPPVSGCRWGGWVSGFGYISKQTQPPPFLGVQMGG